MNPYYSDSQTTLYQGDVREVLASLPDQSVQMVMTSPPYWGLRDYGLEPLVWGGDEHEHEWGQSIKANKSNNNALGSSGLINSAAYAKERHQQAERASQGQFCPCGAWRGSLGLEPTPELYIQHVVEIFREVRRVLRDDGSLWCNMGDSYNGSGGAGGDYNVGGLKEGQPKYPGRNSPSLKPKDLCGLPWMLAFALRADGWYLRSDIIWAKPNPMPESCTDRPTSSHEHLFLLAKSGTPQYWTHRDMNGTRTQPKPDYRWEHATGYEVSQAPENWKESIIPCPGCEGAQEVRTEAHPDLFGDTWWDTVACTECANQAERKKVKPDPGQVWEWTRINLWTGHDYYYDQEAVREPNTNGTIERLRVGPVQAKRDGPKNQLGRQDGGIEPYATPKGRNKRTVWTIATQPFKDVHFAVYPEALCEPPVLAGSSPKACGECGSPWERVVEKNRRYIVSEGGSHADGTYHVKYADGKHETNFHGRGGGLSYNKERWHNQPITTGWRSTCSHEDDTGLSTVLDPFCGTGTTGLVAKRLGRKFIGIDLSETYLDMAVKRLQEIPVPMPLEL